MLAIILAAGQGTRLRPLTNDRPKCMVPLVGKPLLHWQLETLQACSVIRNIVVVGGYRSDELVLNGAQLVINPRYETTNMVATLFCARHHMVSGEDLLISYGDIVYEPRVLETVLACNAPICLAADRRWRRYWAMRMDDPLADAETFRLSEGGQVIELGKKPQSYDEIQAQYMGLIRVRVDYVERLLASYDSLDHNVRYDGKDFDNMYMTSFIQHLISQNWEVRACLVDNGWLEVDTAEELERYDRMAREGTLATFCNLP
jgi:choline kinase